MIENPTAWVKADITESEMNRKALPRRSRPNAIMNSPVSSASTSRASCAVDTPGATSGTVATIKAMALVALILSDTEFVKKAPKNPPTM